MLRNQIQEQSTAPGAVTSFILSGAQPGYSSFSSAFTSGQLCFYTITDGLSNREWGYANVSPGSPDRLINRTPIGNSKGTTDKINFQGTVNVYNALPSERYVYVDNSGFLNAATLLDVKVGGVFEVTGNTVLHGDLTIEGHIGSAEGNVGGVDGVFTGAVSAETLSVTGASNISNTEISGSGTALTVSNGIANFTGTSTLANQNGYLLGAGGVITYTSDINVNAKFSLGIYSPTVWAASDRRLKSDFSAITPETGLDFVRLSEPMLYKKNGEWETGLVAQDQIKAGFGKTIKTLEQKGVEADADSPADRIFVLNPGHPDAYLLAALKGVLAQMEDMQERLDMLEAAA